MTIAVAIIVLIVVLLLGVPIPFAFFASSLTLVYLGGYDYTFLLPYGYAQVSSLILIAIPLFILAGDLMDRSGIGESLINFVDLFIGRIKGGLGAVMVVSCGLFGAISGSGLPLYQLSAASCSQNVRSGLSTRRIYRADFQRSSSGPVDSSEPQSDSLCICRRSICSGLFPIHGYSGNYSYNTA